METTNTTETTPPQNNDYKDIVTYIAESKTALINAALPDRAPKLLAKGYTAAEITAKLQELEDLEQLNEAQNKEYGEQYQATEDYTKEVARLHKIYVNDLTIARVVFKNDIAAQKALGLNGRRKESKSGYQAQALLLYNGALKDANYKTALAFRGITEATLTAQQTGFAGLTDLASSQQKETGEAQKATKVRDEAYDKFTDWMSDFKILATVALSDTPQLREQLGWKEK